MQILVLYLARHVIKTIVCGVHFILGSLDSL